MFVPRVDGESVPVTIDANGVTVTRNGMTITTPLPAPLTPLPPGVGSRLPRRLEQGDGPPGAAARARLRRRSWPGARRARPAQRLVQRTAPRPARPRAPPQNASPAATVSIGLTGKTPHDPGRRRGRPHHAPAAARDDGAAGTAAHELAGRLGRVDGGDGLQAREQRGLVLVRDDVVDVRQQLRRGSRATGAGLRIVIAPSARPVRMAAADGGDRHLALGEHDGDVARGPPGPPRRARRSRGRSRRR